MGKQNKIKSDHQCKFVVKVWRHIADVNEILVSFWWRINHVFFCFVSGAFKILKMSIQIGQICPSNMVIIYSPPSVVYP